MEIYKEDVRMVISDVLELDIEFIKRISEDDNFMIYGMDSVSSVQLVIQLEEKYGIEFQDEDMSMEKFNTFRKLLNLLKRYV